MISTFLGWIFTAVSIFAVTTTTDKPTFSETIAPIVYHNCVTCHRPGEAAPFPLITYDDVRKRGALIEVVTKSRYMPPWHAAHGYGEFKNERHLTDEEISVIAEWVNQGMPQGDPAKMPKLPEFPGATDGWHLGKPDLILGMPVGYEVPATGPDIFRNFAIPTKLTEDKWVRAVEFHPGARKAVHHVLFAYDEDGAVRKLDGTDGHPGSQSEMAPIGIGGSGKSGGMGGWAIGADAFELPDETAMLLPKGSDFVLQTHFHPTGKPEVERSVIGLYFTDRPPSKDLYGVDMPTLFGFGAGINIPAGKSDYTVQDSLILPVDMQAYGIAAHAHYVAKEMKATAVLPDGSIEPIIWIQNWDFNWQETYAYKTPITLPKGTRIDVQLTYDNSADNPRNPNNPPKPVMWGESTVDEMGSVSILMTPMRKEEGPIMQQLMATRQRSTIQRGVQDGTLKRMLDQRPH